MRTLRSRLRHLSYANVMASIAIFVALGGVGYAATTISGNKIIKGTVGAGKLKNGTLTSAQVKQNALNGSVIDESSLTIVPSAQTATSATTATTAGSADTAKSATTAQSATTAGSADTAKTAEHADAATKATEATSADSALTAENADTVEGLSAEQLQVSCHGETEPFGGMCWDVDARPIKNWIVASKDCGDAGGRLPSLSELVAYTLRNGLQIPNGEQHWTGEVAAIGPGDEEVVFARSETTSASVGAVANSLGYRCLFYRVN